MSRGRLLTAALLAAALLSLVATLWLTVFTDREGGVTLLLLRRAPAWPADSYGDAPAKFGRILVRGNENGVRGEDLTRWNARYAVWGLGALALGRLWLRAKSRR